VRCQHDDGPTISVSAHSFDRLAPVKIGQADIHDDKVGGCGSERLKRRFRRLDCLDLKLGMQSQLFDQRLTQVVVIIHDQQLPRLAHLKDFTRWNARRLPQDYGDLASTFRDV
jgi:hypothetical protein